MKHILPLLCLVLLGAGCTVRIPETNVTVSDAIIYTGEHCEINADCTLPVEYAVQSSCAFTTDCVASQCAVVCPPPLDEAPTEADIEPAVVVTNFAECAAAGNPIMESYPEQCRHGDKTFVKEYPTENIVKPTPEPVSPVAPATGITLEGVATESGVKLTWDVTNIDTSKGFKVVKGTTQNPTYGVDHATYLQDENMRSFTLDKKDGKTYHFRVCTYTGDGCDNYSNNISLTTPVAATSKDHTEKQSADTTPEPSVTAITLSANSGNTIRWQTTGDASKGFKIAYSKNSNPVYPKRNEEDNWIFVWDPNASNWQLDAEQGAGTYYVRVCEYIGNACGMYSNEVAIVLE